ncbi:competence protein ComEC [Spirochaetia bacterium]|nr:competence protein ComEC [Spirochaetia bacterium]
MDKLLKYPAVCAALGSAAAYYSFPLVRAAIPLWPRLFYAFIIILMIPVCLFRVLEFRPWSRAAVAVTAGICLGMAAAAPEPFSLGLPPEAVVAVSGELRDDPRAFVDGRGMGSLVLSGVTGKGGLWASAKGKIAVFFPAEAIPRLKDFGRGAELYLEGSVLFGDQGPLFRAKGVHIVKAAPRIEQFRTRIRMGILEKLVGRDGQAEKGWGGLAAALLLGVRDNLDTDVAAAFRDAGCSHILALSGMHLAILSAVIAFFLRKPLGLKAAALAGGVLITAYVYLAGAQPSLVRSAVMYLLGVLAILANLKPRPGLLLALAFLVQIIIQPASGASLSFILSYLALGGILVIGEGVHEFLKGRLPGFLSSGISASLGAFLATAAVTALFFGVLRPVGIFAGLLIMPLATVFMIGSLGVLALNFTFPFLAGPPVFALDLLFRFQNFLVSLAARAPGLSISRSLPVLCITLVVSAFFYFVSEKYRAKRNYLAPFN